MEKGFAKTLLNIICLQVICAYSIFAQADTIRVAGDVFPGQGNLNKIIKQVTEEGKLSGSVFKLELNSRYILTGKIVIPEGEKLKIEAPEPGKTGGTAPPQILWKTVLPPAWPDYKADTTRNYLFECSGNIRLKNIWLCFMDTDGNQVNSALLIKDNNELKEQTGEFEGVIFDYCPVSPLGGGTVTVASKKFNGKFQKCYWRNCTDPHFRYYGRAVSFPFSSTGWHNNSLSFEHCTFANIGYVLMQEGGEYTDNVKFNHCTFLNVVMYSLESGWWHKLALTNSLFVNTFMYGSIPALKESECGTIMIDSISRFGFTVPFKEQDRRILFSNSSYHIEEWLKNWMNNNPYSVIYRKNGQYDQIPQPMPMLGKGTLIFFESVDINGKKEFPFMNKANLYDGLNPVFIYPPTDTTLIKSFLRRKWGDSTSENWAFQPALTLQYVWPLIDNLAYTNETALKAGMGSFPLGDLYRWFPEKYKQWKEQEDLENDRITTWLETGKDKFTSVSDKNNEEIPTGFSLSQNYPNPFNPGTTINYSIPVEPRRASSLQHVTLKIYDLLGREVTTLVNEEKAPGNYEIKFDANNVDRNRDMPSGVYFYTLHAGEYTTAKKMILMK